MSGIKRQILAELANKGITGEQAMKQFSASEMISESGISMYTSVAKPGKGDNDAYLGKQAGPR